MEKKIVPIAVIILGLSFFGTTFLFAAEPVTKESPLKQIASFEKRGFVNFVTSPGEVVSAFKSERKDHPKAWPLTYVPRFFTNMAIRVGSSANDILVLPFYGLATQDTAPLTRRFDLPDYVWEKA